jgi:hypothetical protein
MQNRNWKLHDAVLVEIILHKARPYSLMGESGIVLPIVRKRENNVLHELWVGRRRTPRSVEISRMSVDHAHVNGHSFITEVLALHFAIVSRSVVFGEVHHDNRMSRREVVEVVTEAAVLLILLVHVKRE